MEEAMKQFAKFIDAFYGAPGYMLVAAACLVLGYILRLNSRFPNEKIPLVCVIAGAVLNPLCATLADPAKEGLRLWLMRNILVGVVIGFVAWLFHNLLLKRFEEKIPILGPALQRMDSESEAPSAPGTPPAPEPGNPTLRSPKDQGNQ